MHSCCEQMTLFCFIFVQNLVEIIVWFWSLISIAGLIIESQSPRDNSPSRLNGSPYNSPGVSPGPYGDRTFNIPAAVSTTGARASIPNSVSDHGVAYGMYMLYVVGAQYSSPNMICNCLWHVGGVRPKTTNHGSPSAGRPVSEYQREDSPSSPTGRRYSGTFLRHRSRTQSSVSFKR